MNTFTCYAPWTWYEIAFEILGIIFAMMLLVAAGIALVSLVEHYVLLTARVKRQQGKRKGSK